MKSKVNLLVVDDEPDAAPLFRQRFRNELEKGWVRLETAENGFEALAMLEHYHCEIPLIILSDNNMPGMDGIELLQRIRSSYPQRFRPKLASRSAGHQKRPEVERGNSSTSDPSLIPTRCPRARFTISQPLPCCPAMFRS